MATPKARVQHSQYHHYIPRFVLRNFAEPDTNRTKEAQKYYDTIKRKDGLIRYFDHDQVNLGFRTLSTVYGVTDMYRDGKLEDTMYIEKALSKLEGRAANVIKKLLKTQADKKKTVTLSAKELHILRKFLFIMQYRTESARERFQYSIDEYKGIDKSKLKEHMRRRNFQKPNDVWLETLRLILDAPDSATGASYDELKDKMYDADYEELRQNLDGYYISICEPARPEDEYIITDNGFYVSERIVFPDHIFSQMVKKFDKSMFTVFTKRESAIDFHKIAVIAPRLAVVLRHNMFRELNMIGKMAIYSVTGRPSVFDDLPVKVALANYVNCPMADAPTHATVFLKDFDYTMEDTYELGVYPIPEKHIMSLNKMQLDEVQHGITFSSNKAMRNSISHYLKTHKYIPLSVLGSERYSVQARKLAAKVQLFEMLSQTETNKNLQNVPQKLFSFSDTAKAVREQVENTNYLMLAQGSIDMFHWDMQKAQEVENKRAAIARMKGTRPKEEIEQKMKDHCNRCMQELDIRVYLMSIRIVQSLEIPDVKKWLVPTDAEKCVFKLWGKIPETEFKDLLQGALWKENYRKLATRGIRQEIGNANKDQYPLQMIRMEMYVANEWGSAIEWATRNNCLQTFDSLRKHFTKIGYNSTKALEPLRKHLADIRLSDAFLNSKPLVEEMQFRDFLRDILFSSSNSEGDVFGLTEKTCFPDLFEKDAPWRELLSVWLFPCVWEQSWCEARWIGLREGIALGDMAK